MADLPTLEPRRRKAGQILFALGMLGLALLLLSLITDQTRWVDKTKLYAQPRFWPAVSLAAMALFGGLHLWRLPRRRTLKVDWQEARHWLAVVEYAAWFMAYVWSVPIIGFLPASLIFPPLLCWRMGYRDRKTLWLSALFGAAVVVVFKGFLSVKIPGGAVYEYLPGAMRSFFILNL